MSSFSHIEKAAIESAGESLKGKLKVYLGYAAGVGKTYQMLEEARALASEGTDIVVAYYEPHARPETAALLDGLELIPLRAVEYRGTKFAEMDVDATVARRPQVALVDEFPHTNVPGSERTKRWEDVLFLLNQGIDVWTTMNVQHLESLNDTLQQISGVKIRETIPDWVVQQASEVVMVDLAPRALLNRLDRGVIYQGEKAQIAKANFFKESTLVALREMALRETAFEVGSRQSTATLDEAQPPYGASAALYDEPRNPTEKILVLLTADPSTAALVRRGKRVADYLKGECMAVAVCPQGQLGSLPAADREALAKHLKFAQDLHVSSHLLSGEDVAEEIASFVQQNDVTQIYLSRPKARFWSSLFNRGIIQRITGLTGNIEITIVANRENRLANEK